MDPKGAIVSAIIAGIVSFFTVLWKLKMEQQRQSKLECEKKRVRYLDPLNIATQDLLESINNVLMTQKLEFYISSFAHIKTMSEQKKDLRQKAEFALWCNGEGAAAVTTLYNTVVFFASAKRIRSEMPYIQLYPKKYHDQCILDCLNKIRHAFGGSYGLYIEIQDSLGDYITNQDGTIMNYKCFCSQLINEWDYIWFLVLMDYYVNFHRKYESQKNAIKESLEELIEFIKKETKQKAV